MSKRLTGILSGPLSFFLILFFFKAEGLSVQATAVLAATVWIAIWWVTEAIPISATALLPIVLFPLTGGLELESTVKAYSHPYIFLFIGGFTIAIAMERWKLHTRMALLIISKIGFKKNQIIFGFMLASAFLSMWISNTATTVMMLPIGMAIVSQTASEAKGSSFGKALMLGIAYSASIGGVATLIGTPPNLILAGVIEETYHVTISFMQWLSIGLPFSIVLLVICWYYLTRVAFTFSVQTLEGGQTQIEKEQQALGPITTPEKRVLLIFCLTALAWMFRSYVLVPFLPAINDTIIAMLAALSLFLMPSGFSKNQALLKWEDMQDLPWGVLLLFGGGISLASAFDSSGLAQWLGGQLVGLQGLPLMALLIVLILAVNFLTEITSNLATTSVILPILVPLALTINVHPYGLMIGAAVAASCAFMLPVATPPNALVFGTGYFKISTMLKAGVWLNLISALLLFLLINFLLPIVWNINLNQFPETLMR
jgi:sodium-dependent dicarboxylate transporter 2/3/5